MHRLRSVVAGTLLAVVLPASAIAASCAGDPRQKDVVAKVYDTLKDLPPAQRNYLLAHAGCDPRRFRSLEHAIGECSCAPAFACGVISRLRENDMLSLRDPYALRCGR